MTEDERVRRFQADVDQILNTGQAPPVEDGDGAYGETLATAARLAQADFSVESQVRESLRREIGQRSAIDHRMNPLSWLSGLRAPRIYLLGPTAAVLVMLVIMLAWPGAVAAAAETIERFVRQLVLDESTTVRQIDDDETGLGLEGTGLGLDDDSIIFEDGGAVIWVERTTIHEGADLPPDWSLVSESEIFPDVLTAREHLDFPLREPAELPDGYSLAQVRVTPTGWALSRYSGPEGPILIAHVPQGASAILDSGRLVSTTVEILTDCPIEEVTVNGRTAAWVDGQSLSWVEDGVAYTLSGAKLTLAEAVRIAESMR